MRLWELLGDITPAEIKDIERRLDTTLYQPEDKVKRNKPVVDLVLPIDAHFMDRIIQRAEKANITAQEIEDLLSRAKADPSLGWSAKIDDLSKEQNPEDTLTIQDPASKLTIPAIVVPNYDCKPGTTTDGIPVCMTPDGKAPKNKLIAKTIFRKGVPD